MRTSNFSHIYNEAAYEAATKRRIIENARKTFINTYDDAHAIIDWCESRGVEKYDETRKVYRDNFVGSMARALDEYGKLTERQVEAVRKFMVRDAQRRQEWSDKRAAENARKTWVGEVGKKVQLTLTTRHVVELDGYYGTTWIFICNDQDGNDVIYKGTSAAFPDKGETATIVATVKEHGVRDGVKQTVIQRPKVL